MTDLEGIANRLLDKGLSEEEVTDRLVMEILTFKETGPDNATRLARLILKEVKTARKKPSDPFLRNVLSIPEAKATMHDLGVGCRGEGDFFVHGLIAGLIDDNSVVSPRKQDDAGAVQAGGKVIVASVDGTHSRLSDFPFIAGFHVARAALRDVMVKGAKPVALIDDMHLGDDGDVGKLFDFIAGISAISELAGVPLVSGSTLRIGGDMVVGNRLVSGVGAIGITDERTLLAREKVEEGDVILMTQGAGGGTIATTAIYSGSPDIVKETLNIDFIKACKALSNENLLPRIHAMLDVTNGGVRGDANEVCKTAGVGLIFHEERIRDLVNEKVLGLLEELKVDYLGVSLDALMVFCKKENVRDVVGAVEKAGIKIEVVGEVVKGGKASLVRSGKKEEFAPRYRESAYTEIKKAVGECAPLDKERFMKDARKAAERAAKKKEEVVSYVRKAGS
ncbi:MAG: hypothetical protein JXB14_04315 [Candidatus Altiarchaeota archaeon]|nr:hypothetical protein [Candidatus Altiarchaeota archaeon]